MARALGPEAWNKRAKGGTLPDAAIHVAQSGRADRGDGAAAIVIVTTSSCRLPPACALEADLDVGARSKSPTKNSQITPVPARING